MLCNALKSDGLIRTYKGLFNIPKGVLGKDKVETGATTMIELADYLINEALVVTMLDKLMESLQDDPTADTLDGAILEMKEDPSKIVSPNDVQTDAKKVADVTEDDIDPAELEESAEETAEE